MSLDERTRIENAAEALQEMANIGVTIFEAVKALAEAGYTAAEIRLALDMFLWNQFRIQ